MKSVDVTVNVAESYVHLHNHSDFSLLDGMSKIPEMVKKVKELGMKACALTDHGVGGGLVLFYNECKKHGIKPILGCEFYEAPVSRFQQTPGEKYFHLILLVKNEIGYRNLCKLITRANVEGFYYKPRIDFELLSEFHEGLICTSACIAGRISRLILSGNVEEAEKWMLKYRDLFGDDYYLEIQNHGLANEQIAYSEIIRIAKKYGIKLVCTNDTHYVNSEDAEAHEWLLCIQEKKKITDEDRMVYTGDYSIKSAEQMRALFPALPDAFDNTLEIADKCNFDFKFGEYRMPVVKIPENYKGDAFAYLSDLSWAGFEKRFPQGHPEREKAAENLRNELDVIKKMGFPTYFLDVWAMIKWAHDHGILTGPGRGSAAGSTMCYCLNITDIDPVKYNLLFERFLNPERVSMPDIDTDFDYAFKDEMVRYEAEKNGYDHFSKIQTFAAMLAKGIVRDCASVAGYPPAIGAKIAGMIPKEPKVTLKDAWEGNQDLRNYINSDRNLQHLWDICLKLEGTKKSAGEHACGVIATPVKCEELYPCSKNKEGYLVCQYDMVEAEHLGNLKKDMLMLRNLTIINTAHALGKKRYGIDIPLWTDEILNDRDALALIARGDTYGLFQIESGGMQNFMRKLVPTCFEDIIAGVALYRPGPMDFIGAYIEGKHNPSSIKYLTPALKPILEPTYGVIVYQEQVMSICRELGGFTLGRADVVRRAMGKKHMDTMMEEKDKFIHGYHQDGYNIPGCIANGIPEETANTIYNQMIDFAKYAFNKSHAACYAAVAMQTAYLKAHYPMEFEAGLLTSVALNKLPVYIDDCKKFGVHILPPDINSSMQNFVPNEEGTALYYGLASLKNVGKGVIEGILKEREQNGKFKSYTDLVKRCYRFGSSVLESIIKAGGADFTGLTRSTMLFNLKRLISAYKAENKTAIKGQITLFDLFEKDSEDYRTLSQEQIFEMPEYPKLELLEMERDITGSYISGHPLDEYRHLFQKYNIVGNSVFLKNEESDISDMDEDGNKPLYSVKNKDIVTIAGVIKELTVVYTKKDGRPMAIVTVDDGVVPVKTVVFPDAYENFGRDLREHEAFAFRGNVKIEDENISLICSFAFSLKDIPKDIWIRIPSAQVYWDRLPEITGLCSKAGKGYGSVIVYVHESNWKPFYMNDTVNRINALSLMEEAKTKFGSENVALTDFTLF